MPRLSDVMKKKAFPALLFYTLVICVALYGCYEGVIYFRHILQMRLSEIHSFLSDDDSFSEGLTQEELNSRDNVTSPVISSDDILPWKMLAEVQMDFAHKNGQAMAAPKYSDAIKLLSHKNISIRGFIFPLEQSGKQTHFLLSPYPPSCPYCLPAGPSELVEVWMDKPIEFTYDTITIKGEFEYLEKEDELKSGLFYRLNNAITVIN